MTIIEKINRPSVHIVEGYKHLIQNFDSVTCAIADTMGGQEL